MCFKVPILMYHKISQPPPESRNPHLFVPPANFAAQMRYLHMHGYHTLSLSDVGGALRGKGKLPPRPIAITFDDGYLDNYENAFPILQKYNFTATIFAVSDMVGTRVGWKQSRETLTAPLMSWAQIREMQEGGVAFGSHTCTHPKLNQIPPEHARQEIIASRAKLEDGLGKTVDSFCYPYGEYNQQVVDFVREAGYTAACITDNGNRHSPEDIYTLKRVFIWPDTPPRRFAYYLTRFYDYEKSYKQWRKALRKKYAR